MIRRFLDWLYPPDKSVMAWKALAQLPEEPALHYPPDHPTLAGKSKIARISRYPEADLERLTIRRAQVIAMPRREQAQ